MLTQITSGPRYMERDRQRCGGRVPAIRIIPQMFRILSFSLMALLVCFTHAGKAPSEQIIVEARWEGECGSLHQSTARQLVAWRKGGVRLSIVGRISLTISRIVEGRLDDPDFLKRPTGVALFDVIPLDEAAAGIDANRYSKADGIWKLTRLPDGSYAVFDLKSTPLAGSKSRAELKTTDRMATDLASKDPQVQYNGLRLFRERCCPALFPKVFEMLGSDARVTVPDGMCWDGPNGGGVSPVDSTLGNEAAAALRLAVGCLRGSDTPKAKDSPAAWKAWWEDVLKTQPFPAPVAGAVRCRELIALPLNQSWPEAFVSPDGSRAILSATRFERPIDGMKSGICLLDLADDRRPEWVYQVPATEVNREPRPVQVAWGRSAVGIVFKEFDYDEAKSTLWFLAVDYGQGTPATPREIPLKGTANLALAAYQNGWLLAYLSKKGAAFAVRLDATGSVLGEALEFAPEYSDRRSHFHSGIQNISIVPTDNGIAIAFDGDKGMFLSLFNPELKLLSTVRVDDPKSQDYSRSVPRIAWNGQCMLVSWIQEGGNVRDKLYLRLFDESGKPKSEPIRVIEDVAVLAPPVPLKDGYALAWLDNSVKPNLVRAARFSNKGELGSMLTVHSGIKSTYLFGLGLQGDTAHVLVSDRSKYPLQFLLKSDNLPR